MTDSKSGDGDRLETALIHQTGEENEERVTREAVADMDALIAEFVAREEGLSLDDVRAEDVRIEENKLRVRYSGVSRNE